MCSRHFALPASCRQFFDFGLEPQDAGLRVRQLFTPVTDAWKYRTAVQENHAGKEKGGWPVNSHPPASGSSSGGQTPTQRLMTDFAIDTTVLLMLLPARTLDLIFIAIS
jgi:hypothetical protein